MNKNIIFIVGSGIFSGKEIVSLNLMIGLKNKGHSIFCITSKWASKTFLDALINHKIPFKQVRLGFISKTFSLSAIRMTLHQLLYLPHLLFVVSKIFRAKNPNLIVHSNYHHTILLFPIIPTTSNNIYHTHEIFSEGNFYKKIIKLLERKMNIFVGVSDFVSNNLKNFKVNRPVKTIYNGINYIPNIEVNKGDHELLLKIGIVGQIGEWKGHEDLIDAIYKLKATYKLNCKCYIFGNDVNNPFADYLKEKIQRLGLERQFKWKGFVEELEHIYNYFQILTVPTRTNEPLGMTAIEAGFFKIPVIATNQGGLPEIINDGVNGFLIPPNNPDNLSHAIERFFLNKTLLQSMGESHHQKVNEKFELNTMVKEFEGLSK